MEMNSVSGNPSEASMQLGLLDAVKDLLAVNPVFLIGVIVICAVLILMFRKNRAMPKVGALVGYGCFKLIHKLAAAKGHAVHEFKEPRVLRYLPVAIIVMTLVLGFFS